MANTYLKSVSFSQAIKSITAVANQHELSTEQVTLDMAYGRYPAVDVLAMVDVPMADCSRMDGYAINHQFLRSQEQPKLPLGQAIHAGDQRPQGDCSQLATPVMTGAVLPPGTDSVVMKEHAIPEGALLTIDQPVQKGDHLRQQGSDVRAGKKIIQAHQRLAAGDLGLLASAGLDQLTVSCQPKVLLMMSGDELKAPGQPLQSGQAYDANTPMLTALLEQMGCEVQVLPCLADDEASVRQQLSSVRDSGADLVITVGGVSMGDRDYLPAALLELGQVVFHKVNIKPGFPLLFGTLHGALFFGLPGNPVSAFSCLFELVYPAVKCLYGSSSGGLLSWPARLTHEVSKSHLRREFMRGRYSVDAKGQLEVTVCGSQASSRTGSLAEANCLLVLNESQHDLAPGGQVMIHPFSQLSPESGR